MGARGGGSAWVGCGNRLPGAAWFCREGARGSGRKRSTGTLSRPPRVVGAGRAILPLDERSRLGDDNVDVCEDWWGSRAMSPDKDPACDTWPPRLDDPERDGWPPRLDGSADPGAMF